MNRLYRGEGEECKEDVNVYMGAEKKENGTCKRLHPEYNEEQRICQGESLEFCELRRRGELEKRPVLPDYSVLPVYTVRENTGV
jgi:hypothetical protein